MACAVPILPRPPSQIGKKGGVAEWLKAAVLKTAVVRATGGSNPSSSAEFFDN